MNQFYNTFNPNESVSILSVTNGLIIYSKLMCKIKIYTYGTSRLRIVALGVETSGLRDDGYIGWRNSRLPMETVSTVACISIMSANRCYFKAFLSGP